MLQNKHKLQCENKERNSYNDQEESPKKDIELCLEVEMDDEVREIITSPEKCASTLLDVTIIQPKDIDHLYTSHKKTLNGEEVRKLITSMELKNKDHRLLIDQILGRDDKPQPNYRHSNLCKSAGDYLQNKNLHPPDNRRSSVPRNQPGHCSNSQDSSVFFDHIQRISTTDVTNSDVLSNCNQTMKMNQRKTRDDQDRIEQIYTTPRTYNDLKALFTCKNQSKYDQNEKPNRPCLCQNCAILGLLNDAQKRPFVTENSYDPRDSVFGHSRGSSDKPRRKKSVNFKDDPHTECEYYFRYLSSKIKTLEARLAVQEERYVTKDYFKKIVTKLVSHISKLTGHGSQVKLTSHTPKSKEHRSRDKSYESGRKYYVNPVMVDQKSPKVAQNKQETPTHFKSNVPPPTHTESFWKWGEEILRPGIDLKNKIIDLLEDTLQNLKKPRENLSRAEGSIKNFVDEFSTKLYRTLNELPTRDVPDKKKDRQEKSSSEQNRSNSSSSISKQIDALNRNKKLPPKVQIRKSPHEEPVSVSYFNPKIKGWHEESQISFKFESSDLESPRHVDDKKMNECYKQEFMETISNTKEADRLKLWQSIWNQARTNGQSRSDKVTIQIPNRKDLKRNKMIEIEYTIAELEMLLTGKPASQKGDSIYRRK